MNGPMITGEPTYTGDNTGNTAYVLGLYFFFLFIMFLLCCLSYIYKRSPQSSSPPTTAAGADYHFIRLPETLRDDVLETLLTFLYSETDRRSSYYGSGCSICLADYQETDMLRLLPECGHLFHASCIDTWLKVHRTCPVCRNSLGYMKYISPS